MSHLSLKFFLSKKFKISPLSFKIRYDSYCLLHWFELRFKPFCYSVFWQKFEFLFNFKFSIQTYKTNGPLSSWNLITRIATIDTFVFLGKETEPLLMKRNSEERGRAFLEHTWTKNTEKKQKDQGQNYKKKLEKSYKKEANS